MVDKKSDDSQIEDAQARIVGVSSKEFAAKYRSKKEIFNFLAADVGVYLPPFLKCHHLFFEGADERAEVNDLNQENKNDPHPTVSMSIPVNFGC